MQLQIDKLGKVSITIEEGYWDINKDYDKLTVVEKQGTYGTFISRKPVPAGTVLTNREYWIPFSSLKEEIIIDYNKFINKYQPIIDDIVNRLNDEARLSKNIILVTYEELKTKRDEGSLIPGLWYQITDYRASTTQDNTSVGAGQFDILVLATSENTLSEEAKATRHEGDTYYPDYVRFNAWKLWYCLDNDSNRFYWADEENGTGVIYRMIDEWNNDCPYDFKSIIFYHTDIGDSLTFSHGSADDTENMSDDISTFLYNGEILAKNNKITPYVTQIEEDYKERTVQVLNFISLLSYRDYNVSNYCKSIVQNNILENCYKCFILGCADNKIINSSVYFSVNCMGNYIIRSTLDFYKGLFWANATDISLQYNTISNSDIEVDRTLLANGERWPEAIQSSNIKNTEIYASYINIVKSNILYSTLPKSGSMMPIEILYSYVNNLMIDDKVDNVPLVAIDNSFLNYNSLLIYSEPICIISSNLTNNSNLYIKDIENCSIRNTDLISDRNGLTFENCSIHEVYNLEIEKDDNTLPIKYVELKNIGEQIGYLYIEESSNYHVIHENKRDHTLIADNL